MWGDPLSVPGRITPTPEIARFDERTHSVRSCAARVLRGDGDRALHRPGRPTRPSTAKPELGGRRSSPEGNTSGEGDHETIWRGREARGSAREALRPLRLV